MERHIYRGRVSSKGRESSSDIEKNFFFMFWSVVGASKNGACV
jgi:hypothetical protein